MFDRLRQDIARLKEGRENPSPTYALEALLLDNGFQAVLFHRIAHWFRCRKIPFLGPLFARLGLFFTGTDISPAAEIGPGLRIAHGQGLVIGGAARIGARAQLHQQVTIGARSRLHLDQMPEVGDDIFVAAGASLIGPVRVGNRVYIGVGAVVTRDVPDCSKVVSAAGVEVTTEGAPGASPVAGR